jgi:lantibiotic modifying enzyme
LPTLDDALVRDDIERGLATTEQSPTREVDHLCCGNLGRIDVLLEASRRLRRPVLAEAALRQADRLVRAAKAAGSFQLFANLPREVFNPSLFQGTAGIGYELLRLASPETLPSVLLVE